MSALAWPETGAVYEPAKVRVVVQSQIERGNTVLAADHGSSADSGWCRCGRKAPCPIVTSIQHTMADRLEQLSRLDEPVTEATVLIPALATIRVSRSALYRASWPQWRLCRVATAGVHRHRRRERRKTASMPGQSARLRAFAQLAARRFAFAQRRTAAAQRGAMQ